VSTSVISISAARSGVNGHRTYETKIQQRSLPNLHECTGIFRRALRGSCQISTAPPRPAVRMLLPPPHRRHVLYGAPAGSHAPPQPAIATTVLPATPPPLAGSSAPSSGSGVGSPPPAPAMLSRPCPPRPSSRSGGPRPWLSRCHSSPLRAQQCQRLQVPLRCGAGANRGARRRLRGTLIRMLQYARGLGWATWVDASKRYEPFSSSLQPSSSIRNFYWMWHRSARSIPKSYSFIRKNRLVPLYFLERALTIPFFHCEEKGTKRDSHLNSRLLDQIPTDDVD
jgi:hypothetical protein